MSEPDRPEGGNEFQAALLTPEGWVVLTPWVQLGGTWCRCHIAAFTQHKAHEIAAQLNEAKR